MVKINLHRERRIDVGNVLVDSVCHALLIGIDNCSHQWMLFYMRSSMTLPTTIRVAA